MQLRNELRVDAVALEQHLSCAGGGAGHLRRLPQGRRDLPLADRRGGLHRRSRASGWSARRRRSTPTACCAPPSAARTRCSFSSTSTSTARPTTSRRTPAPNFMIPFGKAKVVHRGRRRDRCDLRRRGAARHPGRQERRGRKRPASVEVIDLRSLSPVDWDTIADIGAQDRQGDRGLRGLAVVGIWRGNRRADRGENSSSGSTRRCSVSHRPTPSWRTHRNWKTSSCRRWPPSRRHSSSCWRTDAGYIVSLISAAAPITLSTSRLSARACWVA